MENSLFSNWIPDRNRWNLPEPPPWVLSKLREFDPYLVIVPSRMERVYHLTRRRQYSVGLGDVAMLDNKHPDTNMFVTYGVVPIAPLAWKQGVNWTMKNVDGLLDELRRRDMWAISGGPEKDPEGKAVWEAVEDFEAAEKAKRRAGLKDMFYHMGRDAWRSIKARSGQRNRRASDYHGAAKPAGGSSTH